MILLRVGYSYEPCRFIVRPSIQLTTITIWHVRCWLKICDQYNSSSAFLIVVNLWRNHKLTFFHEEVIKWKSIYYTSSSSSLPLSLPLPFLARHNKYNVRTYNHLCNFIIKLWFRYKWQKNVCLHRLAASSTNQLQLQQVHWIFWNVVFPCLHATPFMATMFCSFYFFFYPFQFFYHTIYK